MFKIPIFNNINNRKKYSNQRASKKTVNLKKEKKNKNLILLYLIILV